MNTANIRSGVIAGVIAAIFWTVISLIAGGSSGTYIAIWAIILFLIGLIGTVVISSIIESRKNTGGSVPAIIRGRNNDLPASL